MKNPQESIFNDQSGATHAPGTPEAMEPGVSTSPQAVKTIDFEALAHGTHMVCVVYRGQRYLLRSTRNGKLILNK